MYNCHHSRWVSTSSPVSVSIQKLSAVVKIMNTTLLPEILRNEIIDDQKVNRHRKYRKTFDTNNSNEDNDKLIGDKAATNHTDFLSSIESCSDNTHDVHDHRRISEITRGINQNRNFDRERNEEYTNEKQYDIETEDPKRLFKCCFNDYLFFIEMMSDVLSPVVTHDQVCDSFLTVKAGTNEKKRSKQGSDEKTMSPPTSSSYTQRNDQKHSKLSEEDTSHTNCNTSLHDSTVTSYISSMLTSEEAVKIESHFMIQCNNKENEIKLLLNDLYDVNGSLDVSLNSKRILSIEAAIADMAGITDEYTLARAMPRSDYF
jgi:hypothetical protein